jgi:hypothetical protein
MSRNRLGPDLTYEDAIVGAIVKISIRFLGIVVCFSQVRD